MLVEGDYALYKDFDGLKFPTSIAQKQGGWPTLELTVVDVKRNVPANIKPRKAMKSSKTTSREVQLGKTRVFMKSGSGKFVVNGKPFYDGPHAQVSNWRQLPVVG